MAKPKRNRLVIDEELFSDATVHKNIRQGILVTTEDKATLCIQRHQAALATEQRWIAPLGLLLSCGATLAASEFHDFLVPAAVWQAMFLLVAAGSFVWVVREVVLLFGTRGTRTPEYVVGQLRGSDPDLQAEVEALTQRGTSEDSDS